MTNWKANKNAFRDFCSVQSSLPLFLYPWWLDMVCQKGTWGVCIARKGEQITGVLPFYKTSFLGLPRIQMPVLTPYGGAWLIYPEYINSTRSKLKFEHDTYRQLIDQLPKVAYYSQRHPVQLTNYLAFKWQGFEQNTKYTYKFDAPIDMEKVYRNLKASVRNKIKKASNQLSISDAGGVEKFYDINLKSFRRQGIRPPYDLILLKQLDAALEKRARRYILFAHDQKGQYHGAIYLVWDNTVMYNLMLGADTGLRSSGVVQLLLWEGIKRAAKRGLTFDFEGSMMPKVEGVFRSFGAELIPYSKIYKADNIGLKLIKTSDEFF